EGSAEQIREGHELAGQRQRHALHDGEFERGADDLAGAIISAQRTGQGRRVEQRPVEIEEDVRQRRGRYPPAPRPALSSPRRLHTAAGLVDLPGRGDEADVAERLREVPELLAGGG